MPVKIEELTQHSERGVGRQTACLIFGSAAVHAHVLCLHIGNEKCVVFRHDMHPSLTGSREVDAPVFLPGNLGGRVSLCRTLQPCHSASPDRQVHGCLQEGGQLW